MIKRAFFMLKPPLRWLRRMYYRAGNDKYCYICRQSFYRFHSYRNGWRSLAPFVRNLQIIGSDVQNFRCPYCGSNDRERHLVMYFDRLRLWDQITGKTVLHFAPEKRLFARIAEHNPSLYIKADVAPSAPDVHQIDVTSIPFGNDFFDVIICNHVLEHVVNDSQAISELFRILKPGGLAVLQTPYSSLLENSFCEPFVNTDKLRMRFYGQEDHVRVYGRDLFLRIELSGFRLCNRNHADVLPDIEPSVYGVNPREDLILAKKEVLT